MAELSEKYASPGLRWGLYKHDHPKCGKPKYQVMTAKELEELVGIPPDFSSEGQDFSGRFVVCTIEPGDGTEPPLGWKEIPKREKKFGSMVEFAKTPEHWRKLCTMALGRTLKDAGYPDDTDDLKALLLWRRRSIELEMLAAGGPLAELGPAREPDNGDLDAAAKTTTAEHEERADEEPVEAEVIPVGPVNNDNDWSSLDWSEEARTALLPVVASFTDEQVDAFEGWCNERGQGKWWTLTGRSLKTVVAYANSVGQTRLVS